MTQRAGNVLQQPSEQYWPEPQSEMSIQAVAPPSQTFGGG